jgi:RNA polymerase sigma factor (sigma-70 family)
MAIRASEAGIRHLVLAAKDGDDQATMRLLGALTPHIRGIARGYRRWATLEERELMQEGVTGVLRALDRFEPALDTPFWAYATWWVRQGMQRLVAELTGPVVLSDRAMRQLARVKAARREHVQAHGREPTTRDVSARTGIDAAQVDELTVAERRPRGLEQQVAGDGGSSLTFQDLVADPRAQDAYDRVQDEIASLPLRRLVDELDERERAVVRGRFGLDAPKRTLRQLGSDLHISAERVRQIQERALTKLRTAAAGLTPPPARPIPGADDLPPGQRAGRRQAQRRASERDRGRAPAAHQARAAEGAGVLPRRPPRPGHAGRAHAG